MIIGIDPGAKGGIAFYHSDKAPLELHVMPTFQELNKKKKEIHIDVKKLREILAPHKDAKVFVEDVKSMFGISAQVNFKFGYNIGMLHSLLDSLIGPFYLIRPRQWQEQCWIDSDKVFKDKDKIDARTKQSKLDTKATSLNAAQRIFSNQSFIAPGCRTPHDGLVDAALIAYYGSKV